MGYGGFASLENRKAWQARLDEILR